MWGRRQWRKNPDSEKRERRYRLRDQSEWVEVAIPDLRIVDDPTFEAARSEIERRKRPATASSSVGSKRAKHLLSGLIRCSCCGSNYTISGKDYYRCAGQKERGTCGNRLSVRKEPIETATLAVLQDHLLTEEHARLFAEEFEREMRRLAHQEARHDDTITHRLDQIRTELGNLYQNLLAGLASPALRTMITEREAEKARLEAQGHASARSILRATLLPPTLLRDRLRSNVAKLPVSLDESATRAEAADILPRLIESVTIYPGEDGSAEAEVVARVEDLAAWAINDNAAPKGGVSCSMAMVAGTGFEPVTFRL